jgi:hypothetical protein
MDQSIPRAAEFILELASRGRYHFTTDEAVASLRGHVPAVRARRCGG